MLCLTLHLHLVLLGRIEVEAGAPIILVKHYEVEVLLCKIMSKVNWFVLVAIRVNVASLIFLVLVCLVGLVILIFIHLFCFPLSTWAAFLCFLFLIVGHFVSKMLLVNLFVLKYLSKDNTGHESVVTGLVIVRAQIGTIVVWELRIETEL